MIKTYPQSYRFWRYDVSLPPDEWDTDYHSEEYTYSDAPESLRYKNQISAVYLYDDKCQAFLTGCTAVKNKSNNKLYLTSTTLKSDVDLLDLRSHYIDKEKIEHDTPLKIVSRLHDIGIDMLTAEYCRFDDLAGNTTSLSTLRGIFEEIMALDEIKQKNDSQSSRIINLANDFNTFFRNNIGYVGQLLTDFSNGPKFKAELQARGLDGFIFEEESHTHKPTYCIFDYNKLSAPKHEPIHL